VAHKNKKYDREFLVTKVAMMRIKGKSTHTLLDFLMVQVGMSRKIAYEVLGDAQKYIMDITDKDIAKAFTNAIQRLEELYENGTTKERLEIQKEINKLMGLYASEKVDITSGGNAITEIKLIQVVKKGDISE
jgi:hypothetical protein